MWRDTMAVTKSQASWPSDRQVIWMGRTESHKPFRDLRTRKPESHNKTKTQHATWLPTKEVIWLEPWAAAGGWAHSGWQPARAGHSSGLQASGRESAKDSEGTSCGCFPMASRPEPRPVKKHGFSVILWARNPAWCPGTQPAVPVLLTTELKAQAGCWNFKICAQH